jgi:hypothetical protein
MSMNPTIVGYKMKLEVKTEPQPSQQATHVKHVIATPNLLNVMQGDTLQISSGHGTFRVVCVPWPFREPEHEVKTEEVLTFEKSGDSTLFCYITPTGATSELGYKAGPKGEADGAHVIVRP